MKVSSASCQDYDPKRVKDRIQKALSPLGGLNNFVDSGDTVLLKPNLLSPKPPESGIITHPSIVKSMIELLQDIGAEVIVGESSGGSSDDEVGTITTRAFKVSGLDEICKDAGVELVNFDNSDYELVDNPGETVDTIPLPKPVLEADLVIDLPKLKTHTLTMFTGAEKNLYGCVPGIKKREFHSLYPNPNSFSEVVVDILEIIKPELSIMDGVEILHGNGPGEMGEKYDLGTIMASSDPVALDRVAEHYLGFGEGEVQISEIAGERGIGESSLENIRVIGDFEGPEEDLKTPNTGFLSFLPNRILQPISSALDAKPKINADKCKLCGRCYNSCPQETIYKDEDQFRIEHDECIKCLCCQEMCPEGAVEIEEHPLVRLVNRVS